MDMTQAEFANAIGVRTATIQNWENGRSEPTRNKIKLMSTLFNVSEAVLLTGEGEISNISYPDTGDVNLLLLGGIIASVNSGVKERKLNLSREQRIRLALIVYEEFAEGYDEKVVNINEYIKKAVDIGIDMIAK